MVSRGFIIQRPENINRGFSFMFWVYYLIHRYYFPIIAIEAFILFIIGFAINNYFFSIVGIISLEVLYFSIAFHEACHMSFAKIFKVNTHSISYIPYNFIGMRTNFSREKVIPSDILHAIVFAGPFIPICFTIVLIIVLNFLSLVNVGTYVFLGEFVIIDALSLFPNKRTDGRRVYDYIRIKPSYIKTLINLMAYYFCIKCGMRKANENANNFMDKT